MHRSLYFVFAVFFACGDSADTRTRLAHLEGALSKEEIRTLRSEAGLSESQLASMTVAQAEKRLRKLYKPSQNSPGEAFEFRRKSMVLEDGSIPEDALMKAIEHRKQMVALEFDPGGIQRGSWTWLGPGNAGGRCRGLWIQPSSPGVLVLGSAGGGLWRSKNYGNSWEPIADYPASLAIGCIASPKGSNTVVWAGTGEGFGNPDRIRGAGIYRSSDSGKTFTRIPSTATPDFYYVNRIAFHPTDGKIVLAATGSGLWRSTNTGSTWTRVVIGRTLDIKFHPTNGNYVLCAGSGAGSVRRSTNAGVSWTTATGLPTKMGRVELAYSRSISSTIYASVDVPGGNSCVYRSTNGGSSYSFRSATNILATQGWYGNTIWVDPNNANLIVVGGVSLWRSTNGGTTFTDIRGIHVDQHAIVEHPGYNGTTNRIVYVCNDGGIFRAADIRTASPTSGWTNLNNRIGITQFYGGAVTAIGIAYGGTQDNGTQMIASSATKNGRMIYGKDGGQADADPANYRILYGESQHAGIFRSMDAGSSVAYIDNNMVDRGRGKAPFIAAVRLDKNSPNRLWLGSRRLWRTDNANTANPASVSWRLVRSNAVDYSSIDVATGNSNRVVAAGNSSSIFLSDNATTSSSPTWTVIDKPPLPGRYITTVRFHPLNSNHIFVALGGFASDNVWETRNSGATWVNISGTGATALPAAPVRALAVHPKNVGWLYAGTEVGIFVSTDGGRNWSTTNEGPATVSVDELVFWRDNTLHAFTHGRGIYRANAGTNQDVMARTTRASLTAFDGEGNGNSSFPTISANGRFVAFASDATNLYAGDTNGRRDIFVRDRQEGTTRRESLSSTGLQALGGNSEVPDIAANGRFIAFQSSANNLVSFDSNSATDIFVRDRELGTTERVSLSATGVQANGNSSVASISEDGRYVMFQSFANNLVSGDTNKVLDVFRYDRAKNLIVRVSLGSLSTQANGHSFCTRQAVSRAGGYMVFESNASNLVSGDTNGRSDIFLRVAGRFGWTTIRVSVSSSGTQANGSSYSPTISADGRYIVYQSDATNLIGNDTNGSRDVFLYDRTTKVTTRLSRSTSGTQANGASWRPVISDDGSTIVFESIASNLVQDTNSANDIFVCIRSPFKLTRASVDSSGRQATGGHSYRPAVSADGKHVTYDSYATNLVNNDRNAKKDVFVSERDTASTVFPLASINLAGSTSTAHPLSSTTLRLQQAARETGKLPMNIKRISFRRDNTGNNPAAISHTVELAMRMGACDIDAMTNRFSSNWRGLGTWSITRKQFRMPDWRTAPSGLARFDASLPLDQPFAHSGTSDLLWEILVHGNSRSSSPAILDADSAKRIVNATTNAIGTGCDTDTGKNMGHTLSVTSDGRNTSYAIGCRRGPRSTSFQFVMGVSNPNVQLPGFCARVYVDPLIYVPLGATDANGNFLKTYQAGPWNPTFAGLKFYSQLYAPKGGVAYLSYGRYTSLPTVTPGPLMKRLYSTSLLMSTGTLQTYGAVFKLDY